MIEPLRSESRLSELKAEPGFHLHCEEGCEKADGQWIGGVLRCVKCSAAFVPCCPEICL